MTIDLTRSAYILIPVHNRKQITLACLESLHKINSLRNYCVVVIDDGSTDGTGTTIAHHYPEVKILSGDGNLWWTGAIVKGMQYAYSKGAEYFIWLNDDCQLSSKALVDLVRFCQEHPGAIVGCQGMELNQPTQLAFGGKRKTWQGYRFIQVPTGQVVPCDLLSGNLVCIPRCVVDKIGYPNSVLTPHYGGDSLFLMRAKKAGFPIYVDNRNLVFSLPGESKLYPKQWLLAEGEPLRILKLVFVPQSGLSWRVWWQLNWEAYSLWGIIMFLKKYSSILLITLLRFLPFKLRELIKYG